MRYYLDRLEQSGKIRRDRWTSRGIELQAVQGRDAESREPVPARSLAPSTPPRRTAAPSRHRTSTNEPLEIPLLGRVAAGAPIERLPVNDDYEPIEVRPTDPETRVAGKVVGVFRRLD